jgi:hypothetical protein
MNTYAITWSIGETRLIEAKSESDALIILENLSNDDLLANLENIMASFEVMDIELISK